MYSIEDYQTLTDWCCLLKLLGIITDSSIFLMWDLEKFKEILHCVCKGHTQSPSLFSLAHLQF